MSGEFTRKVVIKDLPVCCKFRESNFIHSKIIKSDRIKRRYRKKIHCSLSMQGCKFEFDTVCGKDNQIHFSNNRLINII